MTGLKILKNALLLVLLTIQYAACKPDELKIESVELCENFDSYGVCRETLSKEHTYILETEKSKSFETWYSISNYLYFHSRQTPGFIIRFNRDFTAGEREKIRKNYKAYYNFKESRGEMEGFEIGTNWVGSFQYLGSMLKDRQKEKGEDKNFPYLNNVFPADLEFKYWSENFHGDLKLKLNLVMRHKE